VKRSSVDSIILTTAPICSSVLTGDGSPNSDV
jgi:hypothetical protein